MALMRFDPFRELDRLSEQMMGGRMPRTMPMEAWRRKDEFFIHIDLPGADKDDVDVTVERNVINIRAQRRPAHEEGDDVIVDERPHGTFTRQLFLGDNLDTDKLSAEFDRGVLMLTIPIAAASKPRRIQLGARQELTDRGADTAGQDSNEQP